MDLVWFVVCIIKGFEVFTEACSSDGIKGSSASLVVDINTACTFNVFTFCLCPVRHCGNYLFQIEPGNKVEIFDLWK